jgi:hypothetical protein
VIIEEGTPTVSAGASRPRWTVAIVTAVAILAVAMGGVAGAFLVSGRAAGAGAGAAAAYVPADAVMYTELRLDLPGDQREMLRQVLDRFEPIDTDTLLGAKLGDWLDDQLATSTDPHVSYSADIAPWFNGQLAMSMNDYPSTADPARMTFPEAVAFLGVRNATAARAFADRMRTEAQRRGAAFTATQHDGVEVWSLSVDESHTGSMPALTPGFAYAVSADQLLLGTGDAAVSHAIDVHAGASGSLAQRAELQRLAARLPADRVGFGWFDATSVLQQLRADADKLDPAMGQMLDEMTGSTSLFGVAAARFENDRLTFEAVGDAPRGAFALENRDRGLARWVPSDAIYFGDAPNLGRTLTQAVHGLTTGLSTAGITKDALDQVESALGGDLESYVSWIGDGAMVAGWDGEQPYGGLVLVPTDTAAARQRLAQLTALARLAADQSGSPVSISDETVAGAQVTTFRFDGSSLAVGAAEPVLQYAVTDDRVLIGFGDRFVGRVLALPESQSLAASPRYQQAIASVGGAANAGSSFVDLAALRAAVETAIPAEEKATYEEMALPYLAPLDYVVSVTRLDGSVTDMRAAIVVK